MPSRWPWRWASTRGPSAGRLADLPPVDHRLQAVRSALGAIDPRRHLQLEPGRRLGGTAALALRRWRRDGPAARAGPAPRRWWSPRAWWSSGRRQFEENRRFGAAIAGAADRPGRSWAGPTGGPCWPARLGAAGSAVAVTVLVADRQAGGRLGARPGSGRATSCCTRTICRTTTLERLGRRPGRPVGGRSGRPLPDRRSQPTVPDVAVIFGGPSPEHDVSVLTGLQAARGLAGGPGEVGRVRALFWSKTGEWYEVDPSLEAEAFLEGVPRGAKQLAARGRPRRRVRRARRAGWDGRARSSSTPRWCAATAGPGEDGTLQAALDLAGIPTRARRVAGAALGMDKLAFGSVVAGGRAADPAPGPADRRVDAAALRRALHRQAPVRRLVHRHRRGRGLRHRPGPAGAPTPTSAAGPCSSRTGPT